MAVDTTRRRPGDPLYLPPARPDLRTCTATAHPWLCDRDPGHDDDHANHQDLGTRPPFLDQLARWPEPPPEPPI